MSSFYKNIVRLANHFGGKIPNSVPEHYVKWAYSLHCESRKKRCGYDVNQKADEYHVSSEGIARKVFL